MSIDLQTLHQVAYYLSSAVTRALTAVMQRDSFLYWPFLLSAFALALLVAAFSAHNNVSGEKQSWWQVVREYFGSTVWWHRSAKADYQFYFANAVLLPVIFGVLALTDPYIVSIINAALGKTGAVSVRGVEAASVTSRIVFTLVFFVAYDFGRFVAHCLLHDIPLLWEFHKVHHSAETLTPMTTFRTHPVDLLVMGWVPALTTGLATWIFNQIASPVSFYSFLGLHVVLFASNLISTLRHTHVWLSYGRFWSRWFICPAQHQVHHSCEARHLGRNRGFELAVWDRLYGTLYVPLQKETFRMGLGDGTDGQWHSVTRMYWWPFRNAAKRVLGTLRRQPLQSPPFLDQVQDRPHDPS